MDSTACSIMGTVNDIITEWTDLSRKGKIVLHMDGNGIKRIEFDYFLDF